MPAFGNRCDCQGQCPPLAACPEPVEGEDIGGGKRKTLRLGVLAFMPLYLLIPFCLFSCKDPTPISLFRLIPSAESGISFSNTLTENDTVNIIQYLYCYNGGGVAVGDLNRDGLPDLYFSSNQESNRLYLNQGNLQFEDITASAGVAGTGNWSTGVSMVDFNADGWLDIYLCQVGAYKGFRGRNQLFINQGFDAEGKLRFTDMAAEYGLDHEGFSTQAAYLDYDRDGDLDLYLLCHSVHSTESYRDTASTRQRDARAGDKLFRNDLSTVGRFTEVSEAAGIIGGIAGYGLGIGIGDLNQDGWPDIYVGNDFHENDFLYLNNQDGTFSESATQSLNHSSNFSMGNDLADVNNDGWLDVLSMDMKPADEVVYRNSAGIDPYDIYQFKRSYGYAHQFPRNMLHLNQGLLGENESLRFCETGQLAGISSTDWSWSALLADFDNDADKDLLITNGILRRPNNLDYLKYIADQQVQAQATDLELAAQMPDGKVPNYLYLNHGDGTFEDVSDHWGISQPTVSHGAAHADLDLDGDLDLIVNNLNEPASIYENRSKDNHFLRIQLRGPEQNPTALGSKLTVYTGELTQFMELYTVRGWQSSVEPIFHVGLGDTDQIDSLRLVWPDGKTEVISDVPVDTLLPLTYDETASFAPHMVAATSKSLFQPSQGKLPFQHQENLFYDNKREALIPHLLSTQGPHIAIGDVNGDGREDCFIGGASGQAGALWIQDAQGSFVERRSSALLADSMQEDIGSVLFDADHDGDLDLYVGSGGNEYYHKDRLLRDRLYLNDGSGEFEQATEALPVFYNQSSCIEAADYDQDGDLDLFVGTRSRPVNYGMPSDSYLLLNDGQGHFSLAESSIADLQQLGMVTDAIWTDIEGDQDLDLVVVGEWMPITVFENDNGLLKEVSFPSLAQSHGWWNSIAAADLDQDGDEDWIVGNAGLNNALRPSETEPIRLYLRDFDSNLSKDPILTYHRQGKEYTVFGLDELSKQLVHLKKQFRIYDQFAQSTLEDVISAAEVQKSLRLEAKTFASVIVLNQGNGEYLIQDLPQEAQVAPIYAIVAEDMDGDAQIDLLLGGNFFEVQPVIGRLDGNHGIFLQGDGNGEFQSIPNRKTGMLIDGQVRDMKLIQRGAQKTLIIARNNDAVLMYDVTPCNPSCL